MSFTIYVERNLRGAQRKRETTMLEKGIVRPDLVIKSKKQGMSGKARKRRKRRWSRRRRKENIR